jgi:predicted RecA/RadA family phage recombinase
MQNYVQAGQTISVTAPAAVDAGDLVVVGNIFGVAVTDAESGDPVEISTGGVYTLPRTDGVAWTQGQRVYWDATAGEVTSDADVDTAGDPQNLLIGVSMAVVADTAGINTGLVRLNAAF